MDVVYVRGDDWCGIYFNEWLADEGHSLSISDVLKELVGVKITSFEVKWANLEWLSAVGNLPQALAEVIEENEQWEDPWKDLGLDEFTDEDIGIS